MYVVEDCIVGFLSSTINIFDEGDEDGAEACVRLTSAGGLSTSVTVRIVSSDIDAVGKLWYRDTWGLSLYIEVIGHPHRY